MEIKELISISEELGFADISISLQNIFYRMGQKDCPIILPLIGEFSAGKTSLINSLTDSRQLETATKPTTATIYEIHFGSDSAYAEVKMADGSFEKVEDISSIKNTDVADAELVKIYDTSSRIPQTTLLIDTPGLSSSDPRHKQALVSFLPEADGILLVMDINAQLNRSTIDFIDTISLSNRPVYLILTKCDTKTGEQALNSIKYIEEAHHLPFKKIIKVSANTQNLDEMYQLLDEIQNDKSQILKQVFDQRIKDLKKIMLERITTIIESSKDDSSIQEAINKQKYELHKITDKINRIFQDVESDIVVCKQTVKKQFEDGVFTKLDSLVVNKSSNFDADAISIISNTSTIAQNNLRSQIKSILSNAVKQAESTNVTLSELTVFDMSEYTVEGISYNLNLNEVGHEYDKKISGGLKIAAAVGAVVATAGAASGAVGRAAAGEAISGATMLEAVDTVTDIADTVSDVQSIVSNKKSVERIEGLISQTQGKLDYIDQTEMGVSQRIGSDKGIVESLVGFVTDSAFGKPQRRRAIHEYIDKTLLPTFNSELDRIASDLLGHIHEIVNCALESGTIEMTQALEGLLKERKQQKKEYQSRISRLKTIQNELIN